MESINIYLFLVLIVGILFIIGMIDIVRLVDLERLQLQEHCEDKFGEDYIYNYRQYPQSCYKIYDDGTMDVRYFKI